MCKGCMVIFIFRIISLKQCTTSPFSLKSTASFLKSFLTCFLSILRNTFARFFNFRNSKMSKKLFGENFFFVSHIFLNLSLKLYHHTQNILIRKSVWSKFFILFSESLRQHATEFPSAKFKAMQQAWLITFINYQFFTKGLRVMRLKSRWVSKQNSCERREGWVSGVVANKW